MDGYNTLNFLQTFMDLKWRFNIMDRIIRLTCVLLHNQIDTLTTQAEIQKKGTDYVITRKLTEVGRPFYCIFMKYTVYYIQKCQREMKLSKIIHHIISNPQ